MRLCFARSFIFHPSWRSGLECQPAVVAILSPLARLWYAQLLFSFREGDFWRAHECKRPIALSKRHFPPVRPNALELVAAIPPANTQEPAVKRVHRSARQTRRHSFPQRILAMILPACAESFRSQGGEAEVQPRETGTLLGAFAHRRHHYVDGQELACPGCSGELFRSSLNVSHTRLRFFHRL